MTYPGNNIQGWKTPEELVWMYEFAQRMRTIAEIGVWKGRGTHALCSGCPGTVVAIDPMSRKHYGRPEKKLSEGRSVMEEFNTNMAGFSNLQFWLMTSKQAARDSHFDMVFLDGEKTYAAYKKDLLRWLPLTDRIIAGYDYHNRPPVGVKRAVTEVLGSVNFFGNIWYKIL